MMYGIEQKAIEEAAKVCNNVRDNVKLFTFCIGNYGYENEGTKTVYEAMRKADHFWQVQIASEVASEHCMQQGIKWQFIRVINITHQGSSDRKHGHFIVEVMVTVSEEE